MNNAEKNSFVINQITNALLKLLKTKEMKDISVSEITCAAEVSRISFYRNYDEKEDVLKKYIGQTFGAWCDEFDKRQNTSEHEILGNIFAYLTEYKDFYLLLSERKLFYLLKNLIVGIIGAKPEYPNFGAYTAAFIANGIYGWIEEWFLRGMQESGEEMTKLLQSRNL